MANTSNNLPTIINTVKSFNNASYRGVNERLGTVCFHASLAAAKGIADVLGMKVNRIESGKCYIQYKPDLVLSNDPYCNN